MSPNIKHHLLTQPEHDPFFMDFLRLHIDCCTELFKDKIDEAFHESQLRGYFVKGNYIAVISLVDGIPVGFGTLNHVQSEDSRYNQVRFDLAYVSKDYRRQGIFKTLCENVIAQAITWNRGTDLFSDPIREASQSMLEKIGFQPAPGNTDDLRYDLNHSPSRRK